MVFVIEHDERERESVRKAIERTGCMVVPLADVEAAISLLANHAACDLIVLSATAMDNDPASFDRLQSAAEQPPPPIILYGVNAETRVVLHCLNKGAADFVAKPAGEDELIQAVQSLVEHDCLRADASDSDAIRAARPVGGWIELTANSQLEQFRRLQRFSDALFSSSLPKNVCEDLKMAVEEVGRNAVEWGNQFDPDKQVQVSYCFFDDRVVIKVEDEGEGFAHSALPDPTRDPVRTMQQRVDAGKRPGGYGVFLIHKLVDETIYNEKGNVVLLIKYLPDSEKREIVQETKRYF
ncbi:MAG: ATP-binding protein [Planctomycetaceae bacterium]|nr:ATP-binding protein [Planctomycetaceae bacterium]